MKAYNLEMVQHRPLEVQELYLHGRPMATLPEVLRQFRNLRRLEVTQCGLQEVPGVVAGTERTEGTERKRQPTHRSAGLAFSNAPSTPNRPGQ
jgi:hypothetical protein